MVLPGSMTEYLDHTPRYGLCPCAVQAGRNSPDSEDGLPNLRDFVQLSSSAGEVWEHTARCAALRILYIVLLSGLNVPDGDAQLSKLFSAGASSRAAGAPTPCFAQQATRPFASQRTP